MKLSTSFKQLGKSAVTIGALVAIPFGANAMVDHRAPVKVGTGSVSTIVKKSDAGRDNALSARFGVYSESSADAAITSAKLSRDSSAGQPRYLR
ncbi:MAG TPA: hypothetical protein VK973_07955 [Arenicellales bacterium]|nr:hypothetical protein [Arenicellales bacterium]